jgi:hypothetical protein
MPSDMTRAIEIALARRVTPFPRDSPKHDRLAEAETPLRGSSTGREVLYHFALGAWFDLQGDPRSARGVQAEWVTNELRSGS